MQTFLGAKIRKLLSKMQKNQKNIQAAPKLFDRRLVWQTYEKKAAQYALAWKAVRIDKKIVYLNADKRLEIKAKGGSKISPATRLVFQNLLNIVENATSHFTESEMKAIFEKACVDGFYEVKTYKGSFIALMYADVRQSIRAIKAAIEKSTNPNDAHELDKLLEITRVEAVNSKGTQIVRLFKTLRAAGIIKFDQARNTKGNAFFIQIPSHILWDFVSEKVAPKEQIAPFSLLLTPFPAETHPYFFALTAQSLHPLSLLFISNNEEKKENENGVFQTVFSAAEKAALSFQKKGQTLRGETLDTTEGGGILREPENLESSEKAAQAIPIDANLTIYVNEVAKVYEEKLRERFVKTQQVRLTPSVLPSNLSLSEENRMDLKVKITNFMRFDRRADETSFAPTVERMVEGIKSAIFDLESQKVSFLLDFPQFLSIQKDSYTGDFRVKKFSLRTYIERNRPNHSVNHFVETASDRLADFGKSDFEVKTLARLLLNFSDQVGQHTVNKWFVKKCAEWTLDAAKSSGLGFGTKKMCCMVEEYLSTKGTGAATWVQFQTRLSSLKKGEKERILTMRHTLTASEPQGNVRPPSITIIKPPLADNAESVESKTSTCIARLRANTELRKRFVASLDSRSRYDSSISFEENIKIGGRKYAIQAAYEIFMKNTEGGAATDGI